MIIILSLIVAKVRFTPKDEPKIYTRCIMTMTKVPSTNNDLGGDDHDVETGGGPWKPSSSPSLVWWRRFSPFLFVHLVLLVLLLYLVHLALHVLLVLLSFCPLLPPLQNNTVSQEELECSHLSTAPLPSPPASGSPTSPPFQVATALILKHIGCFLIPGAPTLDPELWTYSKQFYYEAGKDLART